MFVWYETKHGHRIRFFVQANIYQETAINTEMKANIYSQHGVVDSKKFDVFSDCGRKYFTYKEDKIYFDNFSFLTAEDFIAKCANEGVEPFEIYATLEKESNRLQFSYQNETYLLDERPHIRKNIGRSISLVNRNHQVRFHMDEFCMFLNAGDIIPSIV
jgi:hypothetical protein